MSTLTSTRRVRKTEHDWEPAHIADFWDWCSGSPAQSQNYFTSMVGHGIRGFLERRVHLRGRLLDFGCGTGHLLKLLLAAHKQLDGYGLEFSRESLGLTEEKLAGISNWHGVTLTHGLPTPFPDEHFEIITFVETIEHLKTETLHETMGELFRLLKPGGRLLVTTPFDENLEAAMVYCPFCRSEFHRMQHMRNFNQETLRRLLAEFQFRVLFCQNINFRMYQGVMDRLLLTALQFGKRLIRARRGQSMPPAPHLVAIATKGGARHPVRALTEEAAAEQGTAPGAAHWQPYGSTAASTRAPTTG